jgi:alpha-tubulin suppressor-like RCC1 family protein
LIGFGSNANGQLGVGLGEKGAYHKFPVLPTEIEFGEQVVKVACGELYTCILLHSGKMLVCGDNSAG